MWWFVLIFVVLLKIPMLYLGYVIWWAIRNPPEPGEGYEGVGDAFGPEGPPSDGWWRRKLPGRTPRRGPHGSPVRRPRTALTRARAKQV